MASRSRRRAICCRYRQSPCAQVELRSPSPTARLPIWCLVKPISKRAMRMPGTSPDADRDALAARHSRRHNDRLMVADAGNNRIMVWPAHANANGTPCTFVLGQSDCHGVDHNQAAYYPTPAALNMPYGLTVLGSIAWSLPTRPTAALVGLRSRRAGHERACERPRRAAHVSGQRRKPLGTAGAQHLVLALWGVGGRQHARHRRQRQQPRACCGMPPHEHRVPPATRIPSPQRRRNSRSRPGAGRGLPPDGLAPCARTWSRRALCSMTRKDC